MASDASGLLSFFHFVRKASLKIAEPLSEADATVQSMPDASPTKWHLAHTSWFFETLALKPHLQLYREFDSRFGELFNSYYETFGSRVARPRRGLITRPDVSEILAYRDHVDAAIEDLARSKPSPDVLAIIELGCHHEQQHQELMFTDILHLLAQNPLRPTYRAADPPVSSAAPGKCAFAAFAGGEISIGAEEEGFAFDCERPRHRVLLEPHQLANRLVTNAEWIEFIADGGYSKPLLWLSDGWAKRLADDWRAPLYWEDRDGEYWTMTLAGPQPVDPGAPVCHVSFFEAEAFARWAGRRLPTEGEWEHAAMTAPRKGNFAESGLWRPAPARHRADALGQMFGDVWEWTSSAFSPYPHFRRNEGAAGEYNGKFMCGQFVLRGGSCVTPSSHIRPSYRNFFPPDARWQFSGLRLAKDREDD
ncbi:ergothioneine biosynthesis protein EgtB [Rhodoblastus sp.]|uniref:ergothioneine biosynthesis protein EgtB n=1 Tax=Rhodoblastus sp. TaxID=1962975 RepID=UPI0035AE18CE